MTKLSLSSPLLLLLTVVGALGFTQFLQRHTTLHKNVYHPHHQQRHSSPFTITSAGRSSYPSPLCLRTSSSSSSSSSSTASWDEEHDVVVIGSGIGGLSCAALLAYYGLDVQVYESHYHAGGCAHGFDIEGFKFDSGPSLWNGMDAPKGSRNPLGEILHVLGEGKSVKYGKYPGWKMYVPEGEFMFEVGPTAFDQVVRKFGAGDGEKAVQEWQTFLASLEKLVKISTAMTPLALRADLGAVFTVGRFLPSLAKAGFSPQITGPISDVADKYVTDPFIKNWLNFLSFAISGLPADGTIAAAMAYTLRDLHQKGAELDYPYGGSEAIVSALVRALNKHSHKNLAQPGQEEEGANHLTLSAHVDEIIVEDGRAVGIKLRKGGKRIRARKAVVSNASVWDTLKLLPYEEKESESGTTTNNDNKDNVLPSEERARLAATPMTPSFLHLHLGIDATGLPADLELHHTVVNWWDKIDDPQNMAIISIPTTVDPSLAPAGHHVVHCYAAANEPYEIWEGLKTNSPEYKALKAERAEFLYKAVERVIPDVRQRVKVELVASPLTHERFLRRSRGTYGPAWRAGKESFPG